MAEKKFTKNPFLGQFRRARTLNTWSRGKKTMNKLNTFVTVLTALIALVGLLHNRGVIPSVNVPEPVPYVFCVPQPPAKTCLLRV